MSIRHYNNETRTDRLLQLVERDGPYCMGKGCFMHLSALKPIDVHVHHIRPLKDGGCDHLENQVALCRGCHSKEKNGTLELRVTRQGLCVCASAGGRVFDGSLAEASKLAGEGGQVSHYNGSWLIRTAADLAKEKAEADALREAKENDQLTPVMRVNKRCEKPFNEWLTEMIRRGNRYDFETWKNAGAQEFKCSPETIRKYLDKRTNPINGDLKAYSDGANSWLDFKEKVEN